MSEEKGYLFFTSSEPLTPDAGNSDEILGELD
jgi:hypothetical protein